MQPEILLEKLEENGAPTMCLQSLSNGLGGVDTCCCFSDAENSPDIQNIINGQIVELLPKPMMEIASNESKFDALPLPTNEVTLSS